MDIKLNNLNKTIVNCKKCPRLVKFVKKISTEKRKQNINEIYWGKPVPGFGNLESKLAIIGLAPAAHGGTRTGRVFTGDKSSDFLYKNLFKVKISNQSNSDHLNDGLKLKNAFITTTLKCVPPEDKPLKKEQENCFKFLKQEISLLKNLKVIVALGKIGFDACIHFFKTNYNFSEKVKFNHGSIYNLPQNIKIIACYHPSPRNVNTGRINEKKMSLLFNKAIKLAN